MNSLHPTTTETLALPSGRSVSVPKATPTFARWRKPVKRLYGKRMLDFEGRLSVAELNILGLLKHEGWDGVWVDTWRKLFWTGLGDEPQRSLPERPSSIPEKIWDLAKIKAGVWDVFAWKGDRVLFCESKRSKHDSIQDSQREFADYVLDAGLPLESLMLVEWREV
jgi:hypothetical protein